MNGLSTSSAIVNLIALDLNEVDTPYYDIGDIIRRVKDFFEESDSTTDTESIRELENSVFKTVSTECLEFCDSQGLNLTLAGCLRRAKDIFTNIEKLSAELDCFRDDESESSKHVVLRLDVSSDQQTALQDYDRMVCWMAENLAASESACFTLTVRRM